MMNYLRGRVAKLIFWVLLAAFLLFIAIEMGMQGRFGGPTGSIASVNGDAISTQEFFLLYNQELEGPWRGLRGSLGDADEAAMRREVLDRLVDQTLAWQEARRLKLAVNRTAALDTIKTLPAFRNEQGQFDPARYQAVLSRLGSSMALFELEQERGLSAGRLEAFVRESVRVTDLELWLEYLRWNRRMRGDLLAFPFSEAKAKLKVGEDEVKAHWTQNRGRFEKPERARIRHIVVAANAQAGPDALAQAKAKAQAALAEIRKGADFADLARRTSDDANTAPRGGDLGWHARGALIPEYDEVVFKLRTGQVSDVFQTRFGFHVIKCERHESERKPSYESLRATLRDEILTARARAELGEAVARVSWLVKRDKDLAKAAAAVSRRVRDTGWFSRGGAVPAGAGPKTARSLLLALLPVEPGQTTEPVETEEGFFVVQLQEEQHRRPSEQAFLKERAELEQVVLERKQREAVRAYLAGLRAKAKIRISGDAG